MGIWSLPQNLKFRKYSKRFVYGRRGLERQTNRLRWGGCCALIATKQGRLTPKQLQVAVGVINKTMELQRQNRNLLHCSVAIRAPVTKKPLGSRMGRGKGGVNGWAVTVNAGRVVFQFFGYRATRKMFLAFKRASYKLPFTTRILIEPYSRVNTIKASFSP